MKIYYFNDDKVPALIRVVPDQGLIDDITLLPNTGRFFEFSAPAQSSPFVKRWNTNMVLLTYIMESEVDGNET